MICNMPIKTLRYYDEISLITPIKRSESGNYRYYCENQILALFIIRKLKLFGFSLKEIKELIDHSDVSTLQDNIKEKLHQMQGEIDKLRAKYDKGGFLLEKPIINGIDSNVIVLSLIIS